MSGASSVDPRVSEALELLVNASRILSHHNVLDAFGHISIRNPADPSTFFQSGIAAAIVSSEDFVEYRSSNGEPIRSSRISPYSEHYIHAAIYDLSPNVQSVVHSHARPVLPFTVGSQPLRPVIHTAGFLGPGAPVWEIAPEYLEDEGSLAHAAVTECSSGHHNVVLQHGHDFVALGKSVPETVFKAYSTVENARVLRQSLQLSGLDGTHFLSTDEIEACEKMDDACVAKVWPLWLKEVQQREDRA